MTTGDHPVSQDVSMHYNPMEEPYRGNPFPSYRWLRRQQPVHYVEALGAWMVTRYDDVMTVVTDPQRFSSSSTVPWLNEWLATGPPELAAALDGCVPEGRFVLGEDPPDHTRMRAIVNKAFSGRRVNALRPRMRQLADTLIDQYIDTGRMEVVWNFADPYVGQTLSLLMGVPLVDYMKVRSWADDTLLMDNPLVDPAEKVATAERWGRCDEYILDLLERRRAEPEDDMLSDVIHTVDQSGWRMSDPDIVFFFRGLYVGGIHSSRNAITNALLSMLSERQHWENACADPAITPELFEESLRRDAPIRGLLRTTTCQVELGGVSLPPDAALLLLYDAANRDENHFPNPDEFIPGRDNVRDHLAFGQGPHQCVGAHVGRTEGRVALEALTRRLPTAEIAPDYQPSYMPDFFFRGLERLDLVWKPHQ